MSYASKKGFQPGDLKMGDFLGFAFAAAAGIIVAVALDFFQKKEASAIFTLNVFLNDFFGQAVPLFYVIGALMVVGAGSIFIFEPTTRGGAFSMGVGMLAAVMTALPVESTGTLAGASLLAPVQYTPGQNSFAPRFASFNGAQVYKVQTVKPGHVTMDITVTLSGGPGLSSDFDRLVRSGQARARLHSFASGKTWGLFKGRYRYGSNRITFDAPIPSSDIGSSSDIGLIIEIPGYAILQARRNVSGQASVVNWPVQMSPSNQPLWTQRLRTPYQF